MRLIMENFKKLFIFKNLKKKKKEIYYLVNCKTTKV